MNELVESNSVDETNALKGSLIFLKRQLSKTSDKTEIRTFKKFIAVLSDLKEKELTQEQLNAIESYIKYLELEKIPSYSNNLFKQKLSKLRKYLKTKLRFVPKNYYTRIGISFATPFTIGFTFAANGIAMTNKIGIIVMALLLIGIGKVLDLRIQKQNRSFRF